MQSHQRRHSESDAVLTDPAFHSARLYLMLKSQRNSLEKPASWLAGSGSTAVCNSNIFATLGKDCNHSRILIANNKVGTM